MKSPMRWLNEARAEARGTRWRLPYTLGWPHRLWLVYLIYLFLPVIILPRGEHRWIAPTLLTIPVFLLVYFGFHFVRGRAKLACLLGIAALGFGLTPFNPAAFTYLTYAAAMAPFALPGLLRPLALTATLVGVFAVEVFILHQAPLNAALSALICIVCCLASFFAAESGRKSAALKLSHEEVRRLAAVAERERIGRDLHDLLGHTLSLIAIKSELAGKLIERDREAAAREVDEVSHIAREALKQVRSAVTGMRFAALDAELTSARALLDSSGISFISKRDDLILNDATETALAMIVREAITNVQRHACAAHVSIELGRELEVGTGREFATLTVSDDGRGGVSAPGHGLSGISDRARLLGGTLQIESPRGRGTVLRARVPLVVSAAEVSAETRVATPASAAVDVALEPSAPIGSASHA